MTRVRLLSGVLAVMALLLCGAPTSWAVVSGGIPDASHPDLKFWLDANDASSFSLSGTTVNSWSSRDTNDAVTATPSGGTITRTLTGPGGTGMVNFDTSGHMVLDNLVTLSVGDGGDASAFVVAKTNNTANQTLMSRAGQNRQFFRSNGNTVIFFKGTNPDPNIPNQGVTEDRIQYAEFFGAPKPNGDVNFFRNGVSQVVNNPGNIGTQDWELNRLAGGGGCCGGNWNGTISEIILYDRALTPDEQNEVGTYLENKYAIATAYGPPPIVPNPYDVEVLSDNPLVYYRFGEAPGSMIAIDSSGNGNDGTYLGGVTLGGPSATPELGGAAEFDGSSGWVDVPALGTLEKSTIEFWVNADALAGGCCTSIFSTDTFATGNLHFNLKGGLDIEHAIAGGGPNNNNTPDGAIAFDDWFHVVVTYDAEDIANGETNFYVNGVLITTSNHANDPDMVLIGGAIAAWNQNGNNVIRFFNGELDEFAIYDSILSEEQIIAHYNARLGVNVAVPEPATATLALLGFAGLAMRRRRRMN